MGVNSSKRLAAKCQILSKDEQAIVSTSFRLASKNSDKIKEDELMKLWGTQTDTRLIQYINNYLFGQVENRLLTVEFDRFAELFVFCTRGSVEEKLNILLISLGKTDVENTDVPYILVKEYVESIVSSYMKIQKMTSTKQFKSWHSKGCFTNPQNVQRLAESLTHELAGSDSIIQHNLNSWLQTSVTLGQFLNFVFNHLYRISHREKEEKKESRMSSVVHFPCEEYEAVDKIKDKSMIPFCRGLDLIPSYPSLLDLNQIVFINSHLPSEFQFEWRFLFSSEIHGESFSTLIGRIINQGPSVLVVEDRNGYMFGGFAPSSWALGPKYYGNDSSVLFTLSPKMRVFPTSGYNNHYMYLNLHQQTMPNGLAMGGQHGYCGLWLDQEYGQGHTCASCTTYRDYTQMSHNKEFQYRHLEVWGVGPVPTVDEDEPQAASILAGHTESKALLEMSGKKMYSDGLREPDE